MAWWAWQAGEVNTERVGLGALVTPAERERWVRKYQEGDLGLRRFAEVHGLRASQLYYWVYGRRGRTPRRAAGSPGRKAPVFHEVEVLHPSSADPGAGWAMEIAWADGTRLRARPDADPAWILDVAQGLRRPC